MATVYNEEFRDAAAAASFPFSAESTLQEGALVLDKGCFLDALVYPLEKRIAPYYISALEGGIDDNINYVKLHIKDTQALDICTFKCTPDTDTVLGFDIYGSVVGTIVYDPVLLQELIGKIGLTVKEVSPDFAVFAAGLCFAPEADGNIMVRAGSERYQGEVVIAAAGGVHFKIEDDVIPYNSSSSSQSSSSQSSSSQSSSSQSSSSYSSFSSTSSISDSLTSTSSTSANSSSSSLLKSSLSSLSSTSVSSTSSSESPLYTSSSSSQSSSSSTWARSSSSAESEGWSVADAQVAHYKLNDDDNTDVVQNSSGSVEARVLPPAADPSPVTTTMFSVPGKINKAFLFAKDTDYSTFTGGVDTQQTFNDIFSKPFTVACWVNSTQATYMRGHGVYKGAGGSFLCSPGFRVGTDTSYGFLHIEYTAPNKETAQRERVSFESVYPLWQGDEPSPVRHVVITIGPTVNSIKVWIDGEAADLTKRERIESIDMTGFYQDTPLCIGGCEVREVSEGDVIFYEAWSGLVDDMRIFNRPLTEREVLGLYNNGQGTEYDEYVNPLLSSSSSSDTSNNIITSSSSSYMEGWDLRRNTALQYKCNDNTDTDVVINPFGQDGVLTTTTTDMITATGKLDSAFYLQQDLISNTDPALKSVFQGGFTLMMWLKPSAVEVTPPPYYRTLVKIEEYPITDTRFDSWLYMDWQGHLNFNIRLVDTALNIEHNYTLRSPTPIGIEPMDWTHVAVKVATTYCYMYINNKEVHKRPIGDLALHIPTETPLRVALGDLYTDTTARYCYEGFIDDVRIIDRPITTQELKGIYNYGQGTEASYGGVDNSSSSESTLYTSSSSSSSSSSHSSSSGGTSSSDSSDFNWDTTDAIVSHWKLNDRELDDATLIDSAGTTPLYGRADIYYDGIDLPCRNDPSHLILHWRGPDPCDPSPFWCLYSYYMSVNGRINRGIKPYLLTDLTVTAECRTDQAIPPGGTPPPPVSVPLNTSIQSALVSDTFAAVFTQAFSVCGWFKVPAPTDAYSSYTLFETGKRHVGYYDSPSLGLYLPSTGFLRFEYTTGHGLLASVTSEVALTETDQYFHVVINVTPRRADIYLNNKLVTPDYWNNMARVDMTQFDLKTLEDYAHWRLYHSLYMHNTGLPSYDDIRIYNRPLTREEISGIYNNGEGTERLNLRAESSSSESNPEWDFSSFTTDYFKCNAYADEGPYPPCIPNDIAGAVRLLNIVDPPSQPVIPGKLNSAISFPGVVSGSFADNNLGFSFKKPFAIAFWVYIDEVPKFPPALLGLSRSIIEADGTSRTSRFEVGIPFESPGPLYPIQMFYQVPPVTDPSDPLYEEPSSYSKVTVHDVLRPAEWALITISFDGALYLTVNNEEVTLTDLYNTGVEIPPLNPAMMGQFQDIVMQGHEADFARGLGIGGGTDSTQSSDPTRPSRPPALSQSWDNGAIDDLRLFSQPLTLFEIGILWNNGRGIEGISGGGDPSSSSSLNSSSSSSSPSSFSSDSSLSSTSANSSSSSSESSPTSSSSSFSSNSSWSSYSSFSSPSSSLSSASSASSSSDSSSSDLFSRGQVSVNIYGELFTQNQPIVSINNHKMKQAWLAAHPDSALRVQTDSDEIITIGKSKDFGNAT